jgi:hypothetical protein
VKFSTQRRKDAEKTKRRRRGIFVASNPKQIKAPSGAEYAAPPGLGILMESFLQRFRSYGAMADAKRQSQREPIILRRGELEVAGEFYRGHGDCQDAISPTRL